MAKTSRKKKLTPKQQMFILEYLKDFNATRAAQAAGYTGNNATLRTTGSEVLANPDISTLVDKAISERASQLRVDIYYVVQKLLSIVEADWVRYVILGQSGATEEEIMKIPEDIRKMIKKVKLSRRYMQDGDVIEEYNFELMDKDRALEALGKHVGLYRENIHITGGLVVADWSEMMKRVTDVN